MKNPLVKLWLIIGIASGFATVVFFLLTYLTEKVLCNLECREKNEVQLILLLLSLFGLFVGSMLYYFMAEKYKKKMTNINKDAKITLAFLDDEMRKIVESIIRRGGSATQSEIAKDTKLSRVKVSRAIPKLEKRDIVKKLPKGMTNDIFLDRKLKELFIN